MRVLLPALLLVLDLASGCRLAPGGACDRDRDCVTGQHCAEAVCAPDARAELWTSCVVDRDCAGFARCERNVCVLAPGACTAALDCQAWEGCEANTCRPLAGRCGTLDDCARWEECIAEAKATPPLPAHRCSVVEGRCASASDCDGWQTCAATRFCANKTGACGVQADCPADQVCSANACVAQQPPPLDPTAVSLVGTLAPGSAGLGAIAAPGAPLAKLVGLAAGDDACGARVTVSGELVYTPGLAALSRLVPDPFLWAGTWSYPAVPHANDVAVPLPGCAVGAPVAFVLQPVTDELLYACGTLDYRDAAGLRTVSGRALLAWNALDLMLAGTADMTTAPVLLDAIGTEIPLTGVVMPDGDRLVAWRADGDGFRVVRAAGAGAGLDVLEAWTISASGAVALEGVLQLLPAGVTLPRTPVLDRAGAVYQLALSGANDVIVKRTVGAGLAEVVYDEATPAGASLLAAPVRVDSASCLVTGP